MKRLALALAMLCGVAAVHAHKPSDAYLALEREGAALVVQWDIALRDLDLAIGLDADGDDEITWGELKARHAAIARFALSHLEIGDGRQNCVLRVNGHQVDDHADGAYAVIRLAGSCPHDRATLILRYMALFDVDPQHRGLVRFVDDGKTQTLIFRDDAREIALGEGSESRLAQFAVFVGDGIAHIAAGFDHLLFLLSLLLPSVLVRAGAHWHPARDFRTALVDVFAVVTAFTVAHSITLTLGVLDVIRLPSRAVESAIAASVVLAALNNLWPVLARGRWIAAFGFGLVHGLGFAAALQSLALPTASLALALGGFNVGVELGQLAVVAVLLPLAFAARRTLAYRLVLVGGSVAVAAMGGAWLVERALDVVVLPRLIGIIS
jgi:hypothetical protein